jgi:tRNA dimethylallyltransferase
MKLSDNSMRHVVVLAGPTAAGKSGLALELARTMPITIVCADARQAVRGMRIGTAAPTEEDYAEVPHVGFEMRDPEQEYSAADYARYTRLAIDGIPPDRLPIIVGGSGLYIQALIDGFSEDVVPTPQDIRRRVVEELDALGRVGFYKQLEEVDPIAAARYADMNPRRIQRALEYFYTTGTPISKTWNTPRQPSLYHTTWLAVDQPDETLRQMISSRCAYMWNSGLLEETQRLLDRGLDPDAHMLRTIGYSEAIDVLTGRCSLPEAQEHLVRSTWQYVRRQRTWFRRDERYIWLRGSRSEMVVEARRSICNDGPQWCS